MSKLWNGRFSKDTHHLLETFNASIQFDKRLYREDIMGSIAHATMLKHIGILEETELFDILKGLRLIYREMEDGIFEFRLEDEDIHMAIEKRLHEHVGSVAGKLHTARSRNDQVATDMRLYLRRSIIRNLKDLHALMSCMLRCAQKYEFVLFPGYTHLQRAQPIKVGHYFMAYASMFERDYIRLKELLERMNVSPLGAGALAGTPFPIDRKMTAKLLGFQEVMHNSIDAVSDRDYVIEVLNAYSILMMHLSRVSEEIIIFSSAEFGYMILDDAFATGSSIMPQKKNPDIPELIRGKTGRVYGSLHALLTTMKGLPLAYNKDMQEDKEGVFDAVDTVNAVLEIVPPMMDAMVINEERVVKELQNGFLNATDLADYLVQKGIPFRQAHHISGSVVAYCEQHNDRLETLPLDMYQKFSKKIEEDVYAAVDLNTCVEKRLSEGGTSTSSIQKQCDRLENVLENEQRYIDERIQNERDIFETLLTTPKDVL